MILATNRRSILKMGAIAGAAIATPQIMTRAAHARAPLSEIGNPGFSRFRLGAFEVTAINDGMRPGDGIHKIFGADREEAEVSALLEENFLPPGRFVNSFTPALVNTGSELVLFDTGLGAGAREGGLGQLRGRLEASGY